MPTATPPPYFTQNPLLPPDENRARKVKFAVAGCLLLLLILIGVIVYGVIHLLRS